MGANHVETFLESLRGSLDDGSFVKLTLGKHRGADKTLKHLYVKQVELKNSSHLSFLYRHETRDVVKNHRVGEGLRLVRELLGAEFLGGHLFTTTRDLRVEFNRRREAKLTEAPPTFDRAPARAHDRRKERFVELEGNVWLRELGVTNERGEVRPAMGDKFRQINKFVETVAGLHADSPLAAKSELKIADMGSGKGYLTFAVYDYFKNRLGLSPTVVGVEARGELVALCNRVAAEAGFGGLSFRAGHIHDGDSGDADILIALHACDTATDDAIHKGVAAGASVIITAPCCHKELRPQIEPPPVLKGILRHGILLERQSEMLTDTLRALLLEGAGYATKVFEFVSTEHTRKNTMITAVKKSQAKESAARALRQVEELKEFYGVKSQRLETLLRDSG